MGSDLTILPSAQQNNMAALSAFRSVSFPANRARHCDTSGWPRPVDSTGKKLEVKHLFFFSCNVLSSRGSVEQYSLVGFLSGSRGFFHVDGGEARFGRRLGGVVGGRERLGSVCGVCVWGGGEVDKFALATPHYKRNTSTMRIGGNFQKHVALISGRSAIPCGGCAWSIVVNVGLGGRRSSDASAIPSVWVGVYPVVGLDTSRW